MDIPELREFSLVGGTALSLKYGHRKSVDLDLFSENKFSNGSVISTLENEFPNFKIENNIEKSGIFCYIENVKVDIVKHPHPLISDIEDIDGIRMYGTPDIAAMKIKAILGRGRKKDFWDLQTLLEHYSVKQVIDFYEKKFFNQHLLIGIAQAIIYFTDAEESETPVSLKGQTWEKVKKQISKKVRDYLK
jgi:predicted nucleotidyltransferase component of viral defense system